MKESVALLALLLALAWVLSACAGGAPASSVASVSAAPAATSAASSASSAPHSRSTAPPVTSTLSGLHIEGDYLELKTVHNNPQGGLMGFSAAETPQHLALLYSNYEAGVEKEALEIFSTVTGESTGYVGLEPIAEFIVRHRQHLEACTWNGYNLRAFCGTGDILYLSAEMPENQEIYTLPQSLKNLLTAPMGEDRPYFRGYDADPAVGLAAVTDESGLHWQSADGSTGFLSNSAIPTEELDLPENRPEELMPQLANVHIMNGGNTLVATVIKPTSQMGDAGLLAYDLPTGQAHWYFNLFSVAGYVASPQLVYPSATAVVAGGQGAIHWLDLSTYSMRREEVAEGRVIGWDSHAVTADYIHFVHIEHDYQAYGSDVPWLVHTGKPEAPLLSMPGGSLDWLALTPNWAIFRAGGGGQEAIVALRYA